MRTLVLAAATLAAAFVSTFSADSAACGRVNPVIERPVVRRDNGNALRAAQLERQARNIDQQASEHLARARQMQAKAEALEEAVPASFGDAREVILARIDFLLEQAASENGQARMLRVRASELRAEAARLRQLSNGNGNGNGWRGRRSAPASDNASGSFDI